jgi:peptidoglycan hydrolase-like protein with peptidoglycan-binding domain
MAALQVVTRTPHPSPDSGLSGRTLEMPDVFASSRRATLSCTCSTSAREAILTNSRAPNRLCFSSQLQYIRSRNHSRSSTFFDTGKCNAYNLKGEASVRHAITVSIYLAIATLGVSRTFIPLASAQTAAPLTYSQPLSPAGVSAVQQRLKQAGAYAGNTDGLWGRDSAAALERFQRSHGLVAGPLNQATVATLGLNPAELLAAAPAGVASTPAGAAEPLAPEAVRAVQGRLRQLGFYTGQIDGLWGASMQSAIKEFQQGRGLQATGQLNPATMTALGLDPNNPAASAPAIAPAR